MDPYIDQFETLGYGPFAAEQMKVLVKGLDPDFDPAIEAMAGRVLVATDTMRTLLKTAGALEKTTYASAEDPLTTARDVLKRAVKYVESREGGELIAKEMLNGERLSHVQRLRPSKLIPAMEHAMGVIERHTAKLAEHKAWREELKKAMEGVAALDTAVRKSRVERRALTPEVQAGRQEWMKVYVAAKLLVEAVLRLAGKTALMPEVFDDLAEVHRVAGVSDEGGEPPAPPKGTP